MDMNFLVFIAVGLVSSASTYGIAYLLHKRKVDEYSSLQEAIQRTSQLLEGLKQERVRLHQQIDTQTKQSEETLLELKLRVDKKKASVDSQLTLQRYLMIFDNHIPQPFFTVGQVSPMIAMLYPYNLINQRL